MYSRSVVEIDLEAIRENVSSVRRLVGSNCKIWPAVKANAYGHGAVPVSKACLQAGVEGLCVATLEEAQELRSADIQLPILILGCLAPSDAVSLLEIDAHCALCDLSFAKELSRAALSMAKTASVHIKIDTGMGRLGISEIDTVEFVKAVCLLPGIKIEGLFTHFSSADEKDKTFTMQQISTFQRVIQTITDYGIQIPLVHAANSAGVLAYPESYFNVVRPGIMIYGHYPSVDTPKTVPIKKALTLKSRIAFLKSAKPDSYVGYSRTYTTKRTTKIATVHIGYADGYPRALTGCGFAAVRKTKTPIIGRVCMDQLMLDVTNVPSVETGDEVILYGGGFDYLDLDLISKQIGTITHELLCSIGSRVPRVYINE